MDSNRRETSEPAVRDSEMDTAATARARAPFPVVGIGVSATAGAVESLRRLFAHMPADAGMAFIIMPVAPEPDRRATASISASAAAPASVAMPVSGLLDLLRSVTAMPVIDVAEGRSPGSASASVSLEPDHLYVIPAESPLLLADGAIRILEPEPESEPAPEPTLDRTAGRQDAGVDVFLRKLADAYASQALAVILSGTGSDGSLGISAIKEHGGIVLAQLPEDAEFDAMPRSAISTGIVDFVLPAADIPAKLVELAHSAKHVRLPAVLQAPIVDEAQANEALLRDVLAQLRLRTGHDFTHYKRACVLRRLERRLQVTATHDLATYRTYVKRHPEESHQLLKDLLIGVTSFFRDRDSFAAFERLIVPRLFRGAAAGAGAGASTAHNTVRVWCAGCATGEEAYSVAIALLEHAATLQNPPEIQVFATDVDEGAIQAAREGLYPGAIDVDVSPARLRQFFTRSGNGYRISKHVRDRVLFAVHNVIKDPPFSKLDAIVCRNLLIYLTRPVQEQMFELFRFALRGEGCLFLGASEAPDSTSTVFDPLDARHRLFHANATRASRAARLLPVEIFLHNSRALNADRTPSPSTSGGAVPSAGEVHQQLLELFAPPSMVVNASYEIEHLSEKAGRFLRHAHGKRPLQLLTAVRSELRSILRSTLFEAMHTGQPIEARGALLERGRSVPVTITVRPSPNRNLALVLFDDSADAAGHEASPDATHRTTRALQREVQLLREQLDATVEQSATAVEEQRASNEELQAINEDLRVTTEKLETNKAELHAANAELRTVNQQLKKKVEELGETNDDLENLMSSTGIATLFLDRSLRLTLYTPRTVEIFNVIPADKGRPLTDIANKLNYPALIEDAEEVLSTAHPREREVTSRTGRTYLARMVPYRTALHHVNGVVLTFVDVTDRKRIENALHKFALPS
jgi:two-component system, chemotaxis family, CheB/CheR fusion protein